MILLAATLAASVSTAWAAVPWSVDTPLVTAAPGSSPDAAVVVGIEHYQDARIPVVPYAARDADAFVAYLVATRGLALDRIQRLDAPSRADLLSALGSAREAAKKRRGRVWVYFAGHGWRVVPVEGPVEQVLVLHDATPTPDGLAAHGLTEGQVWSTLRGVPAEVVVDACFEGGSREGALVDPGSRYLTIDHEASPPPKGVSAWRAVRSGQVALPFREAEHGLFTFLWLAGARGWADGTPVIPGGPSTRDGQVTAAENAAWLGLVTGKDATQTPEWQGDGAVELARASRAQPLETGPTVDELRQWLPFLARTEGAFGGDVSRWLTWRRGMDAWFAAEEKALQARAAKAWGEVKAYLDSGSPNGRAAVERYIGQYRGASLEHEGEFSFVPVPELEEAWVGLGRPQDTGLPGYGDEMTLIPGGWYRMGSPPGEPLREDEEPQHLVRVQSFELGHYEVTQGLFEQYMRVNFDYPGGSAMAGDQLPAHQVSWCQAVGFANWLTTRWNESRPGAALGMAYEGVETCEQSTGRSVRRVPGANGFRLPTGPEWELGARAGSQRAWRGESFLFTGTNSRDHACTYGNVPDRAVTLAYNIQWPSTSVGYFYCDDGQVLLAPVGSYRPNAWGLFDTTGNVYEWSEDTFGPYVVENGEVSPRDAGRSSRSIRGGSFREYRSQTEISYRDGHEATYSTSEVGFRLARSLP